MKLDEEHKGYELTNMEWYEIYLYVNENGPNIRERIEEYQRKFNEFDIEKYNALLKGKPEDVKILPKVKPDSSPPQYFSCLKCDSLECNGKDRIMAIYQFNENKK